MSIHTSAFGNRGFLSRRAMLRGAGVTLFLPFLESLAPRTSQAAPPGAPVRLVYWMIPNGVLYNQWIPKTVGNFDPANLPASLRPLADAKLLNDFNLLSGVDNLSGVPDGPGDHASGIAAMLTCVPARKSVDNLELGISADQVAAAKLGAFTPRPSLELGMQRDGGSGNCDNGYSCAYARSLSWSDSKTPRPKHVDAKEAFMWLLGNGAGSGLTPAQAERVRTGEKSVLDYLTAQASGLSPKLTSEDREKLDQYLTSVRTVEKQLTAVTATADCKMSAPVENSTNYAPRLTAMMDVLAFAFRCDLTRVATLSLGNAFGPGGMPWIDVPQDYHGMTHAMGTAGNPDRVAKCILWEVEQIAAFMTRLKAIKEGEQTALYNTAFMVSSEVGEGAPHNHDNVACLIAGNAGGAIKTGQHLKYSPEDVKARQLAGRRNAKDRTAAIAIPNTNRLSNVHVSLLNAVGVPTTKFADSTGAIAISAP
jgi:hypothetical protein